MGKKELNGGLREGGSYVRENGIPEGVGEIPQERVGFKKSGKGQLG